MTVRSSKNLTQKVIAHIKENYKTGDKIEKHEVANSMGIRFKQLKYSFDMFVLYGFFDSKRGKSGAAYTYINDLVSDFNSGPERDQKAEIKKTDVDRLFDLFIFGMTA